MGNKSAQPGPDIPADTRLNGVKNCDTRGHLLGDGLRAKAMAEQTGCKQPGLALAVAKDFGFSHGHV
jgi:hypothetical protein